MEGLDVMEPYFDIKFMCKKERQKDLIEFLLSFGNFNLKDLGEIIEENLLTLHQILEGKNYLSEKSLINLIQVFYIFADSCNFEKILSL